MFANADKYACWQATQKHMKIPTYQLYLRKRKEKRKKTFLNEIKEKIIF